MEISEYLKSKTLSVRPAGKPRSEREELLVKFRERLNQARQAPFKPLTPAHVATVLKHIPTEDLYPFFRQCEEARSFSRLFWWSLKTKHKNENEEVPQV